MSSKRVWEIWCPGVHVMERIKLEIPEIAARFFFNDHCTIYPTEPEVYKMEMLNVETNKWVASERLRWNRIGKYVHFPVNNMAEFFPIKEGYINAVNDMVNYLKKNPRP